MKNQLNLIMFHLRCENVLQMKEFFGLLNFLVLLKTKKMSDEWKNNVLVLFFLKNKGDVHECANCSGIKLMYCTLEL